MRIRDLTAGILWNLQEVSIDEATGSKASDFASRLFSLPPELRIPIVNDYMGPCRDFPRITTNILPQAFWKDLLKEGRSLPWLWDLDSNLIDSKDREKCPSNDIDAGSQSFQWNWELLVRQLSRSLDFGIGEHFPKNLPLNQWHWDSFFPEFQLEMPDYEPNDVWVTTGYHDDLEFVPPGLHQRRRVWQLLEEMFVGDAIHEQDPNAGAERQLLMWWDKSGGHLLSGPALVSSIEQYGYARRITGQVYLEHYKLPNQFWQDIPQLPNAPPHPVSGRELQEVMRRRGYPVVMYDKPYEIEACRISTYPRDEHCDICSQ